MAIKIEPLTGRPLAPVLPDLARLRIEVFRDWPYLYDGTLEYEQGYLAKFAAAQDTIIVVARDGEAVVGASTASPMTGHADEFAAAFRARGLDPEATYYFGESVLLPAYRGQGIGHVFFDQREAQVRLAASLTPLSALWFVLRTIICDPPATALWMPSGTGADTSQSMASRPS